MTLLWFVAFFILIERANSAYRFMGARSATVSHQHVRRRVSAIRASTLSCFQDDTTKFFDFVVIGSGVAGLRYALEVSKYGSVAIITKAEPHESNTNYAQGGVSAVLCPSDSVESHMKDTIVAGAYLCDEETVRVSFSIHHLYNCFFIASPLSQNACSSQSLLVNIFPLHLYSC